MGFRNLWLHTVVGALGTGGAALVARVTRDTHFDDSVAEKDVSFLYCIGGDRMSALAACGSATFAVEIRLRRTR